MDTSPEFLTLLTGLLGQWFHQWRRAVKAEARRDAADARVEEKLGELRECLDETHEKISTQNERLVRIETKMEERNIRREER